ncbi:Rieske (2Fe-2S) protein [Sphingobacterium griseoflavum]|nr:Rieske (2Fe-2S) protein [Sphingobacterium griseoflavum]
MDKEDWHLVSDVQVAEGGMQRLKVAGKVICLVKQDGELFAVGNRCPHAGADLAQGWCEAKKIVCPVHRHRFDLTTGRGDAGQGNFIPTYPLKVDSGKLYIGIHKSWWKRLF